MLNGDIYEYIAVYVDDLLIAAKDPLANTNCFEESYMFKLKGTGPIKYHLGCYYFKDDTGTLCFGPRKYIEKMMDQYKQLFGMKPKEYTSSLEKSDHPVMICIGLGLALGLVCLCGTDMMGLDLWDWTSGTGTV
jgi:hypothetical protein